MHKEKYILLKFIRIAFKAYKPYFFSLLFNTIIVSGTTIFAAYTLSIIIGMLELGDYQNALWSAVFVVGIELLLAFLKNISQRFLSIHQEKMHEAIDHIISEKILSLPFSYLEDPYYLELKKNAQMGIHNMWAIHSLMECMANILSSIISLVGLGVVIITFDPILVIVLAIGIFLNILLIVLSTKFQIKMYKDILPINYKYGYYLDTLMNAKNCKDFRLYTIEEHLFENLKDFSDLTYKNFVKIWLRLGVFESLMSTVRYVQMAIVYIMAGLKTIANHFPISYFSLTISSAISFSDSVSTIILSGCNYIRAIEYIKPMIELMNINIDRNEGQHKLETINTITFSHVYFKYPKTEHYVLEDVSFTIHSGEKISIVGLNGAGKTTIVKLICRLYSVTSGKILINDLPIECFEKQSYLEKISAIFQDYKLFAYSILDNIMPEGNIEEVKKICCKVGIDEQIEALPKGYASTLSKFYEEDAIEMSGGQQQKIAIARALSKNAGVLIMDEPTSALDPLAEAEIYENFNALSKNKTAIFISHRMSSSVFCDKILVIDNGKVKNFDSHANLMKQTDSLYYQLFSSQSNNYVLE